MSQARPVPEEDDWK